MKLIRSSCILLMSAFFLFSCNNSGEEKSGTKMPKLKEENVHYKIDSLTMDGYIVYDEHIEGKRPAVLVVHEWWGMNDYTKKRARELAELGYIAMAVDMYGNGKRAGNPTDAGNLAIPFYKDPVMAKTHFDA
ncbi:MAG: dienelactone hydrolase family protein, partial [Ferruginibacter sp.]